MRRMILYLSPAASLVLLAACDKGESLGYARRGRAAPIATVAPAPPSRATMTSDNAVAAPLAGVAREEAKIAVQTPSPAVPAQATLPSTQQATPGSMLIREGNASIQVDSLEIAIARLRDVARRVNGIVANTSMQGGKDELREASIELRVPSERFDDAVNGLTPLGKVESVNVSVADVGEEYVDVTARVANAKRLEQRLIELLDKRTGRLSDVLGVERELARVREEIERYEGRLRYLRTRTSISTLTVSVHEPPPLVASRPGESPIADAFKQAWRNFVGFVAGSIAIAGLLIPLAAFVVVGVLLWRRFGPNLKSAGAGNA